MTGNTLPQPAELKRALNLPLLVFYGLGVTIGAGIYVLIGAVAGHAGTYAYASFVIAALVMGFTVLSYGELTARFPVSAGAAAFVLHGFRSHGLARIAGLLVVLVGLVSAAAIAAGSTGYIRQFANISELPLLFFVILAMGAIAAYGIVESILFAAILAAIEIIGLLIIIAAGMLFDAAPAAAPDVVTDANSWTGILAAGLLAFFAFIGFESLANVAEEAEYPSRNMPRAIILTLVISTALYMALAIAAVHVVPPGELAASPAPLSLVFERATGLPQQVMAAIAILATLNGVVVQIIMVSRVLHGMARQGDLPAVMGLVHPFTQTPLLATAVAVALVMLSAAVAPLERLAEVTSVLSLLVFALVDLALVIIKFRDEPPAPNTFSVPLPVPAAGFLLSLGLIAAALWL
jgi:basic amino acid/polyamine antiporter, APA family